MPLEYVDGTAPDDALSITGESGRLGVRLESGEEFILRVGLEGRTQQWLYTLELNAPGRALPKIVAESVEAMRREMVDELFRRDNYDLYPALDQLDGRIRVNYVIVGEKLELIIDAPWKSWENDPVTRELQSALVTFWIED